MSNCLSALCGLILTLTLAFSNILLIFSDSPLTYGRVTFVVICLGHPHKIQIQVAIVVRFKCTG